MVIETFRNAPLRTLFRGLIFAGLAVHLSGCAVCTIAGAAVSVASGTLTAAADVTSSVVGGAVDIVTPDSEDD